MFESFDSEIDATKKEYAYQVFECYLSGKINKDIMLHIVKRLDDIATKCKNNDISIERAIELMKQELASTNTAND